MKSMRHWHSDQVTLATTSHRGSLESIPKNELNSFFIVIQNNNIAMKTLGKEEKLRQEEIMSCMFPTQEKHPETWDIYVPCK